MKENKERKVPMVKNRKVLVNQPSREKLENLMFNPQCDLNLKSKKTKPQ